ncbi:MAG: KGG domain-containing protein, partial [Caulobacteraceae bacterium]
MPTPHEEHRRQSRRGFAAMDPERRREIASRGGASVPSEKRS